jgi:hypothetical protein
MQTTYQHLGPPKKVDSSQLRDLKGKPLPELLENMVRVNQQEKNP